MTVPDQEPYVSLEEPAPPEPPADSDAKLPNAKLGGAAGRMDAARLAAQLLDEGDRAYLESLRKAGLLSELEGEELLRVASEVEQDDVERRRVDLLEVYYGAGGVADRAEARRLADRFFLQRAGDPATAAHLVQRLSALAPELEGVALERIGGEDGPLVLRSRDHFAAVLDHFEEEADTDQIDLRALEDRGDVPMVTVRGLVHALNVLLDRGGIRERLVSLRGDPEREIYVRLAVAEAAVLARAGHLEDELVEDVMELAAW